jgi:predicted SAM-dependent methyltransferase
MLDKGSLKLDIGGGTNKCDPDFVSVDIQGGDVTAPMWDLPYGDGEVDFIWSSHTLEHASFNEVTATLWEWFRVLRTGGAMIVQVPDFDWIAEYWLTGPDRRRAEALVFGNQKHDGEFHKCAFTAGSLRKRLETAGFEVRLMATHWNYGQETLQATCIKGDVCG